MVKYTHFILFSAHSAFIKSFVVFVVVKFYHKCTVIKIIIDYYYPSEIKCGIVIVLVPI